MGGVHKALVILRCGKVLLLRQRIGSSLAGVAGTLSHRPRVRGWFRQEAALPWPDVNAPRSKATVASFLTRDRFVRDNEEPGYRQCGALADAACLAARARSSLFGFRSGCSLPGHSWDSKRISFRTI